jgi:hypothetical protein
MSTINGQKVFEKCLGVEFQELSVVGDPADVTAQTQCILKAAGKKNVSKQEFNIISSLLSQNDQKEVARYFRANINRLPEAMLRLADKIL